MGGPWNVSEFKIDGFVLVATWSWREAAMNRASSQGHARDLRRLLTRLRPLEELSTKLLPVTPQV
jgi:hypothetical protein